MQLTRCHGLVDPGFELFQANPNFATQRGVAASFFPVLCLRKHGLYFAFPSQSVICPSQIPDSAGFHEAVSGLLGTQPRRPHDETRERGLVTDDLSPILWV